MANVTRFDPFGGLARFEPFGDFGDWFKEFRLRPVLGGVYRSFTLEQDADEGATKAKYTDGVLEVTLPKKPGDAGKRVAIS